MPVTPSYSGHFPPLERKLERQQRGKRPSFPERKLRRSEPRSHGGPRARERLEEPAVPAEGRGPDVSLARCVEAFRSSRRRSLARSAMLS